MSDARTGWPRFRWQWAVGVVLIVVAGAIVGGVLGSIAFGLVIAAVLSIGWVMAYESWRGRAPNLGDEDDDGARL